MLKLACPYCNTAFDVAEPAPSRIPCPRCQEAVPATAVAPPGAHAVEVVDPTRKGRSSKFWIAGLIIAVTAGAAVVGASFWGTKPPPDTAPAPAQGPAAASPPASLSALRYLPANTLVAFAVQPAALDAYAKRKGQTVETLAADAGLPARLFEEFRRLGLSPESVDQLVIALPDGILSPEAVLVLRNRTADDAEVRAKLGAKAVPDRPGHFEVTLFELRMEMVRDGDAYHFAADGKRLDQPRSPSTDHLSLGFRETLRQLSPASVAWIATDGNLAGWSGSPLVKGLADLTKDPDLPKRFEGIYAAAAGLATEPELVFDVCVRSADGPAQEKRLRQAVGEKAEYASNGQWASARLKFDPPADAVAELRKALGR